MYGELFRKILDDTIKGIRNLILFLTIIIVVLLYFGCNTYFELQDAKKELQERELVRPTESASEPTHESKFQ